MNTNAVFVRNDVDTKLFLDPPMMNLSDASKSAYKSDRTQYMRFCRDEGIALGDPDSLTSYAKHLKDLHLKPTSINRKLFGVKRGLIACISAVQGPRGEEISKALYRPVKPIRIAKNEAHIGAENVLTAEEIDALVSSTDEKTGLIIKFLAKTGCRVSEMTGITMMDIKFAQEVVEISVIGKGTRARTVVISKSDFDEINATFQGEEYLFQTNRGSKFDRCNVSRKIARESERILKKHISAHTLRHSFAMNMIKKTRKIQAVSEYLGHSDVGITLTMYTLEILSLDELLA